MQILVAFAGGVAAEHAHGVLRLRRGLTAQVFDIKGTKIGEFDRVFSGGADEFGAAMNTAAHRKRLGRRRHQIPAIELQFGAAIGKTRLIDRHAAIDQRMIDRNRGFLDFFAAGIEQHQIALKIFRLAGAVVLDAELL